MSKIKNLCFDQFHANLTQTCQIQLAFPHLADRPLCLFLFFLPTSLSQRPSSLSTTVLLSMPVCFCYPLNTCLNKTFLDLLPWPSCLVLGYCAFCLAQILPFFPYPEAWHPHKGHAALEPCTFSWLKSLLPPFRRDQNTSCGFDRALEYSIPLPGSTSFQLFYAVTHVDPGSWSNAEPGL